MIKLERLLESINYNSDFACWISPDLQLFKFNTDTAADAFIMKQFDETDIMNLNATMLKAYNSNWMLIECYKKILTINIGGNTTDQKISNILDTYFKEAVNNFVRIIINNSKNHSWASYELKATPTKYPEYSKEKFIKRFLK